MIRKANVKDCYKILEIYNHYVQNTIYTFETTPPSIKEFEKRFIDSQIDFPWFVYELDGVVVGYAYASYIRWKEAYKWSCETTIYLKHTTTTKGIGTKLYDVLIDELIARNFVNIYAVLAVPNPISVRFHEKYGFTKTAHFPKIGYKFNKWVDTAWYQLRLKAF